MEQIDLINTKARDFKRVDWKVFQQHLLLVDWDRVFAHCNVDAVWNSFLHELNEILMKLFQLSE